MKIMFLILPLVYIGGNGYLFFKIWQTMADVPVWVKIIVAVLFWLFAFSLFPAIGLRETDLPAFLMKSMFFIGSVWMAFLLYIVLTLIVLDILKLFVPTMGNTLWYALPLTCILLIYGYINYKHPKENYIDIKLEKQFEGKDVRIAVISDVHLGYGTGISALKKYVDLLNSKHPDLILIVGDLIDNSLKPLQQEPFDEILSELNAPMGIYMVPGNHEYISNIEACEEYLKRTPIQLLCDSIVTLPNGIQLVGRDDFSNKSRAQLSDLLRNTDAERPVVVLDHQPYGLSESDSLHVDLLLCGHTHNGQLWPLNLITDHIFEQGHGYHKWDYSHIWVSSGLSLWGPPFRIGTNSEFAIFNIKGR